MKVSPALATPAQQLTADRIARPSCCCGPSLPLRRSCSAWTSSQTCLTDWTMYLAPVVTQVVPLPAQTIMYIVGVVEIVAGVAVALRPRFGSALVAAWLLGIIINLIILGGFYDVALRDFGLLVGALALNRLSPRRAVPAATPGS